MFCLKLGLVYKTQKNKDVRRLPRFCDLFTFEDIQQKIK